MTVGRLLIIPKGDRQLGSSRYRAYAVGGRLRERGWEVFYVSPARLPNAQSRTLGRLRHASSDLALGLAFSSDVVLCQRGDRRREHLWLMRILQRRGAKLIYDIDDPVDMDHSIIRWAISHADHITVASHHLQKTLLAAHYSVTFLPTCIDFRLYRAKDRSATRDGLVKIGWLGTGLAYARALQRTASVLAALPAKVKDRCCFCCIGTMHDPGVEASFEEGRIGIESHLVPGLNWADEQTVVAALNQFDIGLSPWVGRLGGGSFKIVQYMAVGAVPVADEAGEAPFIVRNGVTGYLVPPADLAGHVAVLSRLVLDRSHRLSLSQAAVQDARARYSLDGAVDTLAGLMRSIC